MITEKRKKEIETVVLKTLNQYSFRDTIPTPYDDLLSRIGYTRVDRNTFIDILKSMPHNTIDKMPEGMIYSLEHTIHTTKGRERFLTFHEISHDLLHDDLIGEVHYDFSRDVIDEPNMIINEEANYAATLFQFQINRFKERMLALGHFSSFLKCISSRASFV